MGNNMWDANQNRLKAFGTLENTFDMFPVGTRVQTVCLYQDFMIFHEDKTGTVTKNGGRYLSIRVKFDEPIEMQNREPIGSYGFNPEDLIVLEK